VHLDSCLDYVYSVRSLRYPMSSLHEVILLDAHWRVFHLPTGGLAQECKQHFLARYLIFAVAVVELTRPVSAHLHLSIATYDYLSLQEPVSHP
jgi:hypothetical protein